MQHVIYATQSVNKQCSCFEIVMLKNSTMISFDVNFFLITSTVLLEEENYGDSCRDIIRPQIAHIGYRHDNIDSCLEIDNSLPHGNCIYADNVK